MVNLVQEDETLDPHNWEEMQRLRQNISHCFNLETLILQREKLQLLTSVTLNVVCFRYRGLASDEQMLNKMNQEIMMTLQERGIAAPSYTLLNGR